MVGPEHTGTYKHRLHRLRRLYKCVCVPTHVCIYVTTILEGHGFEREGETRGIGVKEQEGWE